jgi:hypothetical protein
MSLVDDLRAAADFDDADGVMIGEKWVSYAQLLRRAADELEKCPPRGATPEMHEAGLRTALIWTNGANHLVDGAVNHIWRAMWHAHAGQLTGTDALADADRKQARGYEP